MRFDTPIYFQRVESGSYNADTGDYDEDKITERKAYASVNDTGVTTMNVVYGSIKQGSVTARIQGRYAEPFDYIRIGEKRYRVDSRKTLTKIQAFILSEVQK